jgi:hypothetical protein
MLSAFFCGNDAPEKAGGCGVAWIMNSPGAEAEFVIATPFGVRRVTNFEELTAALGTVGEPCEFPLADRPGVTASVIA